MRVFWQKLSIDWPCAGHAWLWQLLVVMPAAALDRLTRRQLLQFLCILGLLLLLQSGAALDMPFLFGLDLGLVLDVSVALMLLGARGRVRLLAQFARLRLSAAARHAVRHLRRAARGRRVSATRRLKLPKPDDEGGAWIGTAFA